ncbi:hypothetical protein QFC21_002043 [Naganishia friedmannii]|uniref:Uncharacterized protein n=1 Tax=Naganishia friedmannii TaxID=89922 RepID=A0ACC2W0B6_9TREE|nr:hypothetical protein QFC21_002043 [Naganishia friedmannii]
MDSIAAGDPFARFSPSSSSKQQSHQQHRYLTPPFSPPAATSMLADIEKSSFQHDGSMHMSLPPQALFAQTSPMESQASTQSMSSRIPTYQGRAPGQQHSPAPIGSAPLSPPALHDEERRDFAGPSQFSGQPQYLSHTGPSPPLAAIEMQKRATYNPTTTASGSGMPSRHSSMYTKEQVFSPEYTLHPSIAAYQVSHPRRQLINFGPYILLQTLGEGESGKVKLGVHREYGEEVAIKLIRRGSVDNAVRLSKVEREIDVLKTVKHPNIVRLFDVIETEKYIGIILDFANGGELFDHILAHRYLKEKDASKLFAQLISGVHYLHQKNIVHRDLKLENLLLDKHRNVIITDFGFANRFEHRQDDLMATSCGSPCYAAPELVVSDGLYVGSAVDIWSCGVILYAMLSGYLPFDDDPENPDGDNINLLYKYIINTPLTFPDWISPTARDLVSSMLVPNPEHRCTLTEIMNHPWLIPFRPLFARSVDDLESIAQEQMQYKRQTSRKDMQARMKARETARLNYLAQSAGVAPGQLPQKSKAAPQDHQRRHKSDMPTMGMSLQSASVSAPQGPRPIATATGTSTTINQEFRVPPHSAGSSNQTSSTPTTEHPAPLSGSLLTSSLVQNGTRPRAEEDAEVDPISAEGEVRASARQRADDGRQTSTLRMGELTPKRSDGTAAASTEQAVSSSSGSPAPMKRPSPQTKNRHTIQVEYDGEAAYARLLDIQAEKDRLREAKATSTVKETVYRMQIDEAESTSPLPTSQTSPVPLARVLTSGDDSQSKPKTSTSPMANPHSVSSEKMDVDPVTSSSLQQGQQSPGLTTASTSDRTVSEADVLGKIHMPASPTLSPSIIRLVPPTPSKEPSAANPGETGSPSAVHKKAHSDTALQQEHRSSPSLALLPVPSRTASGSSVSNSISSANTQSSRLETSHVRPRVSIDTDARQLSTSSTASLTLAGTSPAVSPGSQESVTANKAHAKKERSRKGMTMNSFGFGKLLSSTGITSDTVFNSGDAKENTGFLYRRESTRDKTKRRVNAQRQEDGDVERRTQSISATNSCPPIPGLLHTPATTSTALIPATPREGSTRSRNSSVMVHGDKILPPHPAERSASNASVTQVHSFRNNQPASIAPAERPGHQHTASSSAAQKVMNWFRRKSVAKAPFVAPPPISREPSQANSHLSYPGGPGVMVNVGAPGVVEDGAKTSGLSNKENVAPVPAVRQPRVQRALDQVDQSQRDKLTVEQNTASRPMPQARDYQATDRALLNKLPRASTVGNDLVKQGQPSANPSAVNSVISSPFNEARLRVHVGVVDQSALTSKPAVEVMEQVQKVLHGMGIEVKRENNFKLRCTRAKRRKAGAMTGMGASSFSSSSIASMAMATGALNNVNRSGGLPSSNSSAGLLPASGGFRNILMRRGSSQNAIASVLTTPEIGATVTSTTRASIEKPVSDHRPEPIYGEHTVDPGDEVKFSIELTRLKNLPGLLSLDIKRLRGNVWSFKFVYQTILA